MNWKKEHFEVAGVSHYADDIIERIAYENDDYSLSARELSESYDPGDRVFEYSFDDGAAELVPEPTNERDPNAVRVEVGGILIGYVKKGSCSRVKNLLKSPDFDHVEVEIGGGKYKRLYEDDETGKIKTESDSCGLFADLYIFMRQDAAESSPAAPASPAAPSGSVPSPAALATPSKKKRGGVLPVVLIVIGVIFLIGGVNGFSIAVSNGIIGLLIGGVLLFCGIRIRRRNMNE